MSTGIAKVLVVVPTYNEADNIQKLITELLVLPISGLEVLVVDDGSPDGTGQIVDRLGEADARIHILHRPAKQGLGTAYVTGFKWALANNANVIVQMDADFSHSPRYVPAMLAALPDYDSVIGSRYTKGGKLDERWSFWRKLLSWWANSVWVHFILRTSVADNTGGFRAWKRDTLLGMNLNQVRSSGYVFQVELTYIAYRMGYTFHEVPIYFEDRQLGQSKMGLAIQVEAALGVLSLRWRYRHLNSAMRTALP